MKLKTGTDIPGELEGSAPPPPQTIFPRISPYQKSTPHKSPAPKAPAQGPRKVGITEACYPKFFQSQPKFFEWSDSRIPEIRYLYNFEVIWQISDEIQKKSGGILKYIDQNK